MLQSVSNQTNGSFKRDKKKDLITVNKIIRIYSGELSHFFQNLLPT